MSEKICELKKSDRISQPMTITVTFYRSIAQPKYAFAVIPCFDHTKIKLISATSQTIIAGAQATFYSDEGATQQIGSAVWNPFNDIGVSKDIPSGTKTIKLRTAFEQSNILNTIATFQLHN